MGIDECISGGRWSDLHFRRLHNVNNNSANNQTFTTLLGWIEAVREARRSVKRVFVGMHMFAGSRRKEDIQWWIEMLCLSVGLSILFISIDLDSDAAWDLSVLETFAALMELAELGYIDFVGGGPPCGTFSVARFRKMSSGPRPVRFRGQFLWSPRPITDGKNSS